LIAVKLGFDTDFDLAKKVFNFLCHFLAILAQKMAKRGSLKLRWSVYSLKKGRVLKGTVKALRVGSLHEKRDEP
jgi:hypothetical protein